jgi:hypothetical protein
MPTPQRAPITITAGSTVLEVLPEGDSWARRAAEGRLPAGKLVLRDFSRGLGHFSLDAEPRGYLIGTNVDTRWEGVVIPGPREEADMTGIASGYRVRQRIMHGGVNWVLTDNGTNTKVYRVETGAWVEKLNVNSTIGTCMVSFKDVIAVGLGNAVAYQYSSNDGTAWTASSKATNSKYMNRVTIVQPARDAAKVAYCVNPNLLYFTEDLTNTSESTTSSTVGDNDNDEFNSIISDDNAALYMGKRNYLYTIASDGSVWAVDGPRRYFATSEAGAAGLANYEAPIKIEGRLYFPYEDSNILELNPHTGAKHEHMEPAAFGPQVPRLQLPLNAMTEVAGWLVIAIGSASTSTIRSGAVAPGSTALLANTFATTSELYFGKYVNLGGDEGERWVWHGSMLTCTDLLGHMWYDDDSDFLYLASSASESVNLQQVRCFVPPINPLFKQTSSIVKLNTGTWTLETGLFQAGESNVHITKTWRTAKVTTRGLASTTPSLAVKYRVADDDTSTAYSTLATYTTPALARTGTSFPASTSGHGVRFQFVGVGNASDIYAQLYRAEMEFLLYPPALDSMSVSFKAVSGQVLRTGARATTSMKEMRAALDTIKDATTPFSVTDNETGDTWQCVLTSWEERGSGRERVISMNMTEVS